METVDPQRVRHLLLRTLRRPPSERQDFLVDACGGDLALLSETRAALARENDATATLEPVADNGAAPQREDPRRAAILPPNNGPSTQTVDPTTSSAPAHDSTETSDLVEDPAEADSTDAAGSTDHDPPAEGLTAAAFSSDKTTASEPTYDHVGEKEPSDGEGTATLEPAERVELAKYLDTAVSWASYEPKLLESVRPQVDRIDRVDRIDPDAPPVPGAPTATLEPDAEAAAGLDTIDPAAGSGKTHFDRRAARDRTIQPTPSEGDATLPPIEPVRRRHIGPYTLIDLLGEGGMGSVYLAEQKRPLKRRVALKLMQTGRMSPTARARFDAERQALARLEHPNVGRILDAGATDDGELFFAMELVEGQRITDYCDEHRLSVDQRVALMVQVCRGVEHAHRRQLLHRDLKPSNIQVTEVDGQPVPKIIDFGIAKALDQPLTDETLYTGGWILGTPAYMSPEALDGRGDLDTRSDVYGLGMVLYEVLSGERPFELQDSSLPQILRQVLEVEPPRPSDRFATIARDTKTELARCRNASPPELRRRLSGDLDWIVLRAIAKDREARYGSAAELAADLERHLEHKPVVAGPPDLGYRLNKFVRRHRTALVMAAMLLGLVVAATVLLVRARWHADHVALVGQSMSREVEQIEWLQRVAHQLPPQDLSAERDRLRQSMGRIEHQMAELGETGEGPGSYALGRGALALGDLDRARENLEKARDSGYQPAEVSLALGQTLGELYERRLEAIRRLPVRSARERAREVAVRDLRDPALAYLAQGREAKSVTPALLDARIALYHDELDTALEAATEAARDRPWLWEAHLLRSRVWRLRADATREANDIPGALAQMETAEEAVSKALEIGRGDPAAHLRKCALRVDQLTLAATYQQPGIDQLLTDVLDACAVARQVDPDNRQVDLEESIAWGSFADVQVWDRQIDPAESLDRMRGLLRGVLAVDPDSEEAQRLLGRAETTLVHHLLRAGEDPIPAMDEATRWFDSALVLAPGHTFIHLDLVDLLASRAVFRSDRGFDPTDDLERIRRSWRVVSEEDPSEHRAHFGLARALIGGSVFRSDRGIDPLPLLEEAGELLARCLEIDTNMVQIPNVLAYVHLLEGRWLMKSGGDAASALDEAAANVEQAIALNPQAPFNHLTAGQVALNQAIRQVGIGEDPTETIARSRRLYIPGMEKLPRLPGPYAEHAELALAEATWALRQGVDPGAAIRRIDRRASTALEIEPGRSDAHRTLGQGRLLEARWQRRQGRSPGPSLAAAKRSLDKALEAGDDSVNRTALAQWALVSLGGLDGVVRGIAGEAEAARLVEGLGYARKALEIDPAQLEAQALQGALLACDPATRDEGILKVEQALASNANLAGAWRPWLERQRAAN